MKTNVAEKVARKSTHEGAKASNITPEQQLRRVVLACMLFEDQFYLNGVDSAKAIDDAVEAVLRKKNGPKIVSSLAVEARSEGKLRHAPLYLALSLVRAGNKKTKLAEECRAVVAETLTQVIHRPDELSEFLALYWKDGKTPISKQVKLGLAAAFQKFNEYSLAKYANREGKVKLRDVLFLVHPKPLDKTQQKLWDKLAKNELTSPDTWEVALSGGADKKETFTRLIREKKLGSLALLRNLRNMQQSGVDSKLIKKALSELSVERVLPFRFVSAAKYAPSYEPELEAAMFKSLEKFEKLPGKTVLVVDNSGSMYGCPISSKSELDRSDAACALAMLVREICEESEVVVFGSTAGIVPNRRGFALRDAIKKSKHGGGTDTRRAKDLADTLGYDRIIIFTDEQSHTSITSPKNGAKGYVVNVASYQNGIGYGQWNHIDGFSENILSFIQQYESEE